MDIEKYLSTFVSVTIDPSLYAMEFFMKEFGNPDKKTKFIHICRNKWQG